jgi:hypothetical protein
MAPKEREPSEQAESTPGKIRTWWHPLLVSLLRWQLGNHYHVEEEVPIGQKPLQIDILLLQKEKGELPPHARKMLAGIVEHLGESTLIEIQGAVRHLASRRFADVSGLRSPVSRPQQSAA